MFDVVMILARVRRLSVVSVQVISGAGSIEYFIVFHTYYKYTTGLVFLSFRGVIVHRVVGLLFQTPE